MSKPESVYFPNLNGIRFIAALLVIIHHNEQLKDMFGLPNCWSSPVIYQLGSLGVILFFVLSGFLITYLLLHEREKSGTIQVGHFYMRRVLRIWPLYFMVILLALFVFPYVKAMQWPGFPIEAVHSNMGLKLLFFFTFLSNLVLTYLGVVPFASQTWSIGLEEQFYLIWPVLVKYVRHIFAFLFIGLLVMWAVIYLLHSSWAVHLPLRTQLNWMVSTLRFDSMAIGGIFAVALHRNYKILKVILNPVFFYAALIGLIYVMGIGGFLNTHLYVYQLLFAIVILNFAAGKTFLSLENPVLSYLGKISYGLYMLHPIAIILGILLMRQLGITNYYAGLIVSIGMTIALASFSYQYMEKRFLKLKGRFSTIVSGDDAKNRIKEKK
jgi:peptidoglycan/LPS O-acetylase OafA/YrhL